MVCGNFKFSFFVLPIWIIEPETLKYHFSSVALQCHLCHNSHVYMSFVSRFSFTIGLLDYPCAISRWLNYYWFIGSLSLGNSLNLPFISYMSILAF